MATVNQYGSKFGVKELAGRPPFATTNGFRKEKAPTRKQVKEAKARFDERLRVAMEEEKARAQAEAEAEASQDGDSQAGDPVEDPNATVDTEKIDVHADATLDDGRTLTVRRIAGVYEWWIDEHSIDTETATNLMLANETKTIVFKDRISDRSYPVDVPTREQEAELRRRVEIHQWNAKVDEKKANRKAMHEGVKAWADRVENGELPAPGEPVFVEEIPENVIRDFMNPRPSTGDDLDGIAA